MGVDNFSQTGKFMSLSLLFLNSLPSGFGLHNLNYSVLKDANPLTVSQAAFSP